MNKVRGRVLAALVAMIAVVAAACGRGGPVGNQVSGSGPGGVGGVFGNEQGTPLSIRASTSNVTYCSPGGRPQTMDIYKPSGSSNGPAPAVLYVHGGAWYAGDKDTARVNPETGTQLVADWITALQKAGMLVAAIDYRLVRLIPRVKFPDPIEDVKCAVRYFRANAGKYDIDPNRIGAFGGSAGGHLVSLLATANSSAGWDVGQYTDESSKVQAVVDLFGPTDLPLFAREHANAERGLAFIFGNSSQFLRFSPINYVSGGDPPILIIQGEADPVVPVAQSQDFFHKLRGAGVPSQLVLVKNGAHSLMPSPPGSEISPGPAEIRDDIVNWFVRYLG